MTIQVSERLLLRGEAQSMRTTPLRAYLDIVKPAVIYANRTSACWRGYVGEWELNIDRLYLLAIKASILKDGITRPARLTDYFPDATDKVFAHWFSGELVIPVGRPIRIPSASYSPRFEEEIVLTLKAGVLVNERRIKNNEEEPPHA